MTILAATCWPQVPPEQLREVAQVAEESGLAELWLWEDCFWGGAPTLASAILAWTDRLPVAIGVLPVPLRNVALAAMETAALHRLFPGRVTVGVGHGVQGWMGQVGARAESPLTLLSEYLRALRGLLNGEQLKMDGRYVRLDDVALGWAPPVPPALYCAAAGPRTLRVSGQLADGTVLDSSVTPDKLRAARLAIDEGRRAAGRVDPHPVVVYLLTVTGPDAAERLASMGRVGAAVAGDAEQVAEAVRFWAGAGADKVVLYPPLTDSDPVAFLRFAAWEVQPLVELGETAARRPVGRGRLGPLAVGGGEPVVDQRHHGRDERRHQSARDEVGDAAAPARRQREQD
jgi:alkanesulfonate monooxygenase SsuD/methylene tetrahydromethanopterin reductase-like flavin-dependent oxidoreductase (luciferase family)